MREDQRLKVTIPKYSGVREDNGEIVEGFYVGSYDHNGELAYHYLHGVIKDNWEHHYKVIGESIELVEDDAQDLTTMPSKQYQLDIAAAQLTGFHHANWGDDVSSLAEAMGMSKEEWEILRNTTTLFDRFREELDVKFGISNGEEE